MRLVTLSRLVLVLMLVPSALCAEDLTVVSFDKEADVAKIVVSDVKVSSAKATDGSAVLHVSSGHKNPWPGLTLKPEAGAAAWDLSKFENLTVDIKNTGTEDVQVNCRVDNPGADGVKNCVTDHAMIKPGERKTLTVNLPHPPAKQLNVALFGMNGYPAVAAAAMKSSVDPAKINQLVIFLAQPQKDYEFELSSIRATGNFTPAPIPAGLDEKNFFPFIDTFGQYIHADWPGKTHSVEELKARIATEATDLAAKSGPPKVDQYGGFVDGPKLEATGFFRTQKVDGKWWLVDPDGRLFWSHGIDCVQVWQDTPVEERENWFQNFPGDQPEYKSLLKKPWKILHGHYAGKLPNCFFFSVANLMRKYGADWQKSFNELAHLRMKSWGLNTIGSWSSADVYLLRKTPYTVFLSAPGKPLEGSEGFWGKFRDVFDPSYEADLKKRFAEQEKAIGDPWCLGYFIDNEMAWGDDTSLSLATLKSPAEQPAKKVFLADLKAKYTEIAKLNAVWGTAYASWDALAESRTAPDKEKARADLTAFYTKTAEQYFKTSHDVLKAAAPKQLYLGCRFAWTNDLAVAAAVKYCDVISFNLYHRSIADFTVPGKADVPLLVGEFHFGALDRGMFHTGLVPTRDQAERASLYKSYVTGALKHPNFVGVHWFQYMDEPTTGRSLDGENYQIGFVDGTDTPYPEIIESAREIGWHLYELRAGK